MVATLWLLGCFLMPAQTARSAGSDSSLLPRLERGTELVYRGTFTEQSVGDRVRFQRAYRFETRALAIEASEKGADLAVMTHLQDKSPRAAGTPAVPITGSANPSTAPRDESTGAVRLERVRLDANGRVSPGFGVPVEGPPSIELGMFVELPTGRLKRNQGWENREPGQPARAWQVAGQETVLSQPCVKLVGIQASDDWEKPRADRGAWRRVDTVWIATRNGLAVRVERVTEQREPASREVSRTSTLRYDLESDLRHPPAMLGDRRLEIARAIEYRLVATPMLPQPARSGRELAALLRKINAFLESQPPTPYREAVLGVRRQVEAASRGEVVMTNYTQPTAPLPLEVKNKPAPEFVATSITGTGNVRLSSFKGKPTLLLFYQPRSETAPELLRWAQDLHATLGKHVHIVGMSASDETTLVLKQRTAAGASFPILHGSGLRASYGVEATPTCVIVDAEGHIRHRTVGWGRETGTQVQTELRRWLSVR
jgi:peroxiredoxin